MHVADGFAEVVGGVDLHGGAAGEELEEEVFGDFHFEAEHHALRVGGMGDGLLGAVDGEAFDVFAFGFLEGEDDFLGREVVYGDDAEEVFVDGGDVDAFDGFEFVGEALELRQAVEAEGFEDFPFAFDAEHVPPAVAFLEGVRGEDAVGGVVFLEFLVEEGDEAAFADGAEEGK